MDRTKQNVDELIDAASLEQLRELARSVFENTRYARGKPDVTDYHWGDGHSDALVDAKFDARNDLAEEIEDGALQALTTKVIEVDKSYVSIDKVARWPRVTVRRIWPTEDGKSVAFDIHGTDRRGRPSLSHSVMPYDRFADSYDPA